MEKRKGGGEQRAGLVWDQMSSQWGRKDEVRDGGKEGGVRKGVLSSCHAIPVVYIMSILYHTTINHRFRTRSIDDFSDIHNSEHM